VADAAPGINARLSETEKTSAALRNIRAPTAVSSQAVPYCATGERVKTRPGAAWSLRYSTGDDRSLPKGWESA
jgi:hypothetical protein